MGRRKKEVVNNINENPTGWIDGAMPEPVSCLPTAPDPKPTPKIEPAADPDPIIEKPKKVSKPKKNDGYYPETSYKGYSFIEALRKDNIDSSFINRKNIAMANGISNYLGLGKDNKELLEKYMNGKLRMPLV